MPTTRLIQFRTSLPATLGTQYLSQSKTIYARIEDENGCVDIVGIWLVVKTALW